jgi:sarcosine reductase
MAVRLELATYTEKDLDLENYVRDVQIDDPRFASATATLVRPGSPVRITHVLDAVEPRVDVDDPLCTFPGAYGALKRAGQARMHRVSGVAVLVCGDFPNVDRTLTEQEGLVDMAGPGAEVCHFSTTTNVVLEFQPADGIGNDDFESAMRNVKFRVAREVAEMTLDKTAATVETFSHRLCDGRVDGLPAIVLLFQLAASGPLHDNYLYGATLYGHTPGPLNPLEILGGAVTSEQYHWASLRNPTYFYQNSEIVQRLLRAHGNDIDFRGVVAYRGLNLSASDKERSAMLAAGMAEEMGADGVIVTTDATGNAVTDMLLTVRECERLAIRTVGILAELGGLADHVPEADCLVSVGDAEELVPEWSPELVLGGAILLDGRPAINAGSVPVRNYVGATNQTGQMRLRGVIK